MQKLRKPWSLEEKEEFWWLEVNESLIYLGLPGSVLTKVKQWLHKKDLYQPTDEEFVEWYG